MKKTLLLLLAGSIISVSGQAQIYDPAPYCHFRVQYPVDRLGDTDNDFTGFTFGNYSATLDPSDSSYLYYNTDTIATYAVDSTYPIKAITYKAAFGDMTMSAYIDFNHDNQFGPDELIFNHAGIAYYTDSAAGNVTIPSNALPGVTRLRIVMTDVESGDTSSAADPCALADLSQPGISHPFYGEAIDFNINIAGGGAMGIQNIAKGSSGLLYPNPATNIVFLPENMNGASITIIDLLGKVVAEYSSVSNGQIDVSRLASGMYIVKVNKNNETNYQRLSISK